MTPVKTQTEPPEIATLAERRADEIEAIMSKYPTRRSGVMAVLWMVQDEQGWVSSEAMEVTADICKIHPSEVMEMVTFYTMYHRKPVGQYVLNVCGTLPCALCGAEGLLGYLKETLGIGLNETTEDGLFTIKEAECLGACSEAPLMQVNQKMALKLTRQNVDEIIARCRRGENL